MQKATQKFVMLKTGLAGDAKHGDIRIENILAIATQLSDFNEILSGAARDNNENLWRMVAAFKGILIYHHEDCAARIEETIKFMQERKFSVNAYDGCYSAKFAAAVLLGVLESKRVLDQYALLTRYCNSAITVLIDVIAQIEYSGLHRSIIDFVGLNNYREYSARLSDAAKAFFANRPQIARDVIVAAKKCENHNSLIEEVIKSACYGVFGATDCRNLLAAASVVLAAQTEETINKSLLERIRLEDEINP
ncbi:MAG: hypothetical protein WCT26_03130 [Candidatus Buchananbacteria bacterium]